jgi:hypothetical protein
MFKLHANMKKKDLLHNTYGGTLQRSWLRHYATSRKVAGSSPDEVDFFN